QDPVLADESDQRHEPHFGIDIEANRADVQSAEKINEDKRAADRHRHRDQDDDRIAEALELRREREKNDDAGEPQREEQRARFLDVLPRRPGVVDRIPLRQRARPEVLMYLDSFALGTAEEGTAEVGG